MGMSCICVHARVFILSHISWFPRESHRRCQEASYSHFGPMLLSAKEPAIFFSLDKKPLSSPHANNIRHSSFILNSNTFPHGTPGPGISISTSHTKVEGIIPPKIHCDNATTTAERRKKIFFFETGKFPDANSGNTSKKIETKTRLLAVPDKKGRRG